MHIGITLGELYYGAEKSQRRADNLEAIAPFIARLDVLPFGEKGAAHYGQLRAELVLDLHADEMAKLQNTLGAAAFSAGRFKEAGKLFLDLSLAEECPEFLTLRAYDHLYD